MDYKIRQGQRKLKISLLELRKMGIFEEIEPPSVVYHMTDEENLQSILSDGKIKTFNDFVTFFFPDVKSMFVYIRLSDALHGKKYYNTDNKLVTAPPLDIEHTVLLKLVPRHEEKLKWYREIVSPDNQSEATIREQMKIILDLFNQCKIVHYGNFAFRTDSVEVTRLKDMYDNIPQDVQKLLDWINTQQRAQ